MKKLFLLFLLLLFAKPVKADFYQTIENIDKSSKVVEIDNKGLQAKIKVPKGMISLKNAKLDEFVKVMASSEKTPKVKLLDVLYDQNELENNIVNKKRIDREIRIFISTRENISQLLFNKAKKEFKQEFLTSKKFELVGDLYEKKKIFSGTHSSKVNGRQRLLNFSMIYVQGEILNIYIRADDNLENRKWIKNKISWIENIYKNNKGYEDLINSVLYYFYKFLLLFLAVYVIYRYNKRRKKNKNKQK